MKRRRLGPGDEALLEAFLVSHRDSSMFLRSNARRGGLEDRGRQWQASYVGAFQDGQLVGVAAHCWNGMLLMQAPEGLEDAVGGCVAASRRSISGFSGPIAQVRRARAVLGLESAPVQLDEEERLFALDLSTLVVPEALSSGRVKYRPPLPAERGTLHAWRIAYDVEALGARPRESSRKWALEFLDAQIADGHVWVAVDGKAPVSLSTFNAALPDIVQLGGIYTPPERRGCGYAKVAVAGSLLVAIQRGASRAVLFTKNPNAIRSYEAVGFRCTGEYGLVLLAKRVQLAAL